MTSGSGTFLPGNVYVDRGDATSEPQTFTVTIGGGAPTASGVAGLAGVSIASASRVLNGLGGGSPVNVEMMRVLEEVTKVAGYHSVPGFARAGAVGFDERVDRTLTVTR